MFAQQKLQEPKVVLQVEVLLVVEEPVAAVVLSVAAQAAVPALQVLQEQVPERVLLLQEQQEL